MADLPSTSDALPASQPDSAPGTEDSPQPVDGQARGVSEAAAPQPQHPLQYLGIVLGTIVLLGALMAAALWIWQDSLGFLDAESRNAMLSPDNVITFAISPTSTGPDATGAQPANAPRVVDGRELAAPLGRRIAELVISDDSSPPVSLTRLDPVSSSNATTYTVQYRMLDGTVIDVEYVPANNSLFVLRRRNAESHREVLTRKTPAKELVQIFLLLFPAQRVEETESIQL